MTHRIIDDDPRLRIDPGTRQITPLNGYVLHLIQDDHNSERITFEMPRFVDEHDMLTSSAIKVHYNNISASTKEQNSDVYIVDDVRVSPDSDDVVIFSWLISGNATMYAGVLAILISFECTTGETIDYAWHTGIYSDITVGEGMNNGEASIREYTDVLAHWQAEIDRLAPCALMGLEQTQKSTESSGVNVWTATFGDGHKESLEVRNGDPGEDGKDGVDGRDGKDGDDGADGMNCFVRYSHYPDGTDFSKTFGEHEYIGFVTGLTAPTDKRGYTWCKFRTTAVNTATSLVFDTEDAMHAWIQKRCNNDANGFNLWNKNYGSYTYYVLMSADYEEAFLDYPDDGYMEEGTTTEQWFAPTGASLTMRYEFGGDEEDVTSLLPIRVGDRVYALFAISGGVPDTGEGYAYYPAMTEVYGHFVVDNGFVDPVSVGTNICYSIVSTEDLTIESVGNKGWKIIADDATLQELVKGRWDIDVGTNFYVGGEGEFNRYVWDGKTARLIESAQKTDPEEYAKTEEVEDGLQSILEAVNSILEGGAS